MSATARVGYFCSACSFYSEIDLPGTEESATRCDHCGHEERVQLSESLRSGGRIDRCPMCDNRQFYTRKDFPQQLGCAAVSGTIALSSIAYALWDFPAALLVLVVASLADFTLYHRLSEVTVCYRCHAELRGFAPSSEHGAFDMHRAEEYEQGR